MKDTMIGNLVMNHAGRLGMIYNNNFQFYYVEWFVDQPQMKTRFYYPAEIEEMTNRYKKYRMENAL